jgi:hypothetical protein
MISMEPSRCAIIWNGLNPRSCTSILPTVHLVVPFLVDVVSFRPFSPPVAWPLLLWPLPRLSALARTFRKWRVDRRDTSISENGH